MSETNTETIDEGDENAQGMHLNYNFPSLSNSFLPEAH